MKKCFLILLLSFLTLSYQGIAQKIVSIEDIWQNYVFSPKSVRGVNWMKDGQYYTSQSENKVLKYNITTGKEEDIIFGKANHPVLKFDSYDINATEDKIIFSAEVESIYRHSSREYTYIYDIKTNELKKIQGDKHSNATLSPDGTKLAFVRGNNLFTVNLADLKETQITNTGVKNNLINGMCDWVYEEEFGFTKALFWSPDSKKIAFYVFNESAVKEYNMQLWNGSKTSYPDDYKFKYPKAGEANSEVNLYIHHLETAKNVKVDIGNEIDIYIPRVKWTQNAEMLSLKRLNRLQNQLDILHADAQTGATKVVFSEKSNTYIDLEFTDELTYLNDGKFFVHSSEQTGFKHLYLYDINGKLVNQITTGDWEVSNMLGIDEKAKLIYYTSTEDSPLERQIYSIGLDGKNKKKISTQKGTHNPNFSKDFKFYLDYYTSSTIPTQVSLYDVKSGKMLKTLEDNQKLQETLKTYTVSYKEFFKFKTPDGTELNGWMIKPHNFDASKKYPVFMFLYGGPGSQQVLDTWDGANFFWYQHLASKGYMVVCVDNRGTGGRGEAFKKVTYKNLGKYETQDQIDAAKYVGNLPFVDKDRIGIWGWSYGGYMSSLCLLLGNDVFKMAIAVAPVTTWRFYDSIYTERFLQRPQDNAKGYDDYSPITHADKLKGKYLLIHGTGDDNVHFQNTLEMQNALIKANKQFDSFIYPNRNHGIYGGNTRLHLYMMMTNFIEKNL